MNLTPDDHPPEPATVIPPPIPDPELDELNRQVLAHVREFGSRKYLANYKQALNLKQNGVAAPTVRKSLLFELPKPPVAAEGGIHFISKVQSAKLMAMYYVVSHAVEDALANRPPEFREEHAQPKTTTASTPSATSATKPH